MSEYNIYIYIYIYIYIPYPYVGKFNICIPLVCKGNINIIPVQTAMTYLGVEI